MYKLWPEQAQYMSILTFIWPLWPWPSIYLKKCFKWHFSTLRATTVENYFAIHAQMYKLCTWQAQYMYMTILTFIWPLWSWPSTYLKKTFQMALLVLEGNNCAKINFEIHAYMYKLWPGQAQYMTILTFIWPLWPWPSTYLKKCFKWTYPPRGQQLWKIIL